MTNNDTSLQRPNSISQAQNSAGTAHNAVTQAQSHPSEQLVEQAENALERAEQAVKQAMGNANQSAVEQTRNDLAEDRADLESLKD
jgi:hypothetical protein